MLDISHRERVPVNLAQCALTAVAPALEQGPALSLPAVVADIQRLHTAFACATAQQCGFAW